MQPSLSGAARLRAARRDRRRVAVGVDAHRLLDRGSVRASCRFTGCGGRRSARSSSASSGCRSAHARRRLRRTSTRILGGQFVGRTLLDARRAEVHLVGDLSRQRHVGRNARAAVHDRRRHRRAARRASRIASPRRSASTPHVAALVGMAAIFAGASHALLASIVFAFETTRQPMGLLPLLAGCSAAYLVVAAADAQLDHDGEARAARHARAHRVHAPTFSIACSCATRRRAMS